MSALEEQLDRDPHDVSAFLVYADALLEQGSPLGELIRVQHALSQTPGDAQLARRDLQLRERVFPAMKGRATRWELGFPRALHLLWVTAEEFPVLEAALRSPACRFLEAVTLSDYVTAERISGPLEQLPRLEEVNLVNNLELVSTRQALQLLEAVQRLTRVRRLGIQARSVGPLLGSMPVLPDLQRLTLTGPHLNADELSLFRFARGRAGPACELRLEQTSLSFALERALAGVWPFVLEPKGSGLLVEAPRELAGMYLLSSSEALRLGHHVACDLCLPDVGLRAVHSVFQHATLREAGNLDARAQPLRAGEAVTLGAVMLRYCEDVAKAREELRALPRPS